jgi:hypothetical protein
MITAESFLLAHRNYDNIMTQEQENDFLVIMREYGEMVRQECLKQAADKARTQHVVTRGADYYIVNKDSILNAFSKKNIR